MQLLEIFWSCIIFLEHTHLDLKTVNSGCTSRVNKESVFIFLGKQLSSITNSDAFNAFKGYFNQGCANWGFSLNWFKEISTITQGISFLNLSYLLRCRSNYALSHLLVKRNGLKIGPFLFWGLFRFNDNDSRSNI